MRTSAIIVPKQEANAIPSRVNRIVSAYSRERSRQEVTEVELNRTKIVMIDENGNIKKIPILPEH